jgi:hypothetical protein
VEVSASVGVTVTPTPDAALSASPTRHHDAPRRRATTRRLDEAPGEAPQRTFVLVLEPAR